MPQHPGAESAGEPDRALPGRRRARSRALLILWPAFAMACVLEGLVFSMVDPADFHGFGSEPLAWSRNTVYSMTFLMFWAVTAAASGITQWLMADEPQAGGEERT